MATRRSVVTNEMVLAHRYTASIVNSVINADCMAVLPRMEVGSHGQRHGFNEGGQLI